MSIQTISPLSKTQPQQVLDRHMQGRTLYLARVIYVALLLIIVGLTSLGIPESIQSLAAVGRYPIYNVIRIILFYPVGFGIISLILFLRRSNDWLVFSVALALLLYGGDTLLLADGARNIGLYPFSVFLSVAGIVLISFLFLTFPNGIFVPAWTQKFFWFVVLLGLVTFSRWSFSRYIPWLSQNSTGPDFLDWIWQLVTGVWIYAQIYRFRYFSTPLERQQVKWMIAVLPISFLLVTAQFLFLHFYPGNPYSTEMLRIIDAIWRGLISLADLFVAITAALAVYRYKLWETDFYLIRTLVFSLVAALLAGLWWFGAILVQLFLDNFIKQESSPIMVALLSGIPAATLFQPLRENTRKWVNTRLYKDQVDFTKVIVELQSENWQFVSLHDMAQAVMKNTARVLEINKAAISVFDGETMQLMDSIGIPPDQANQLNEMNVSELQKGKVIQLGKENPFTMLVPLVVLRGHTNDLIGLLALGPRAQDCGYSRDHINNLKNLGERAGMAIHFLQLNEKKRSS